MTTKKPTTSENTSNEANLQELDIIFKEQDMNELTECPICNQPVEAFLDDDHLEREVTPCLHLVFVWHRYGLEYESDEFCLTMDELKNRMRLAIDDPVNHSMSGLELDQDEINAFKEIGNDDHDLFNFCSDSLSFAWLFSSAGYISRLVIYQVEEDGIACGPMGFTVHFGFDKTPGIKPVIS